MERKRLVDLSLSIQRENMVSHSVFTPSVCTVHTHTKLVTIATIYDVYERTLWRPLWKLHHNSNVWESQQRHRDLV